MAEFEWKIAKAGQGCCVCNSAFAPGRLYFSALIQTPESLVRQDYCAGCFQASRPAQVYYFWKTAQPEAGDENKSERRQRVLVDVEYVFEFFKRLEGDAAPQRQAFRYILALMLTRKKVLVAEGKKKDAGGNDVHVFREKRGGQSHQVAEPALSEDEVASVSVELGVLLGLSAPAAPQRAAENAAVSPLPLGEGSMSAAAQTDIEIKGTM